MTGSNEMITKIEPNRHLVHLYHHNRKLHSKSCRKMRSTQLVSHTLLRNRLFLINQCETRHPIDRHRPSNCVASHSIQLCLIRRSLIQSVTHQYRLIHRFRMANLIIIAHRQHLRSTLYYLSMLLRILTHAQRHRSCTKPLRCNSRSQ